MKKLMTILICLFIGITSINAQESKTQDQIDNIGVVTDTFKPIKTRYTYPYKGEQVPVYQGKKGGYYINCVSNQGSKYKRYLKIDQILKKNGND